MTCTCCQENPATEQVHGWISDMSGLTSGVVYVDFDIALGRRSIWHAFKGDLCGDCVHDYMMPDNDNGPAPYDRMVRDERAAYLGDLI